MSSVDFPNEFYIGKGVDPKSGESTDKPFCYDPDDLTTHAVVVGMTGSGKTGLCLDIMEEAALNNLPAILIDPKGDITNLLLHFPELLPDDFEPWMNADDARREGKTTADAASETAALWKNGLKDWGIESDRIQRLKDSVDRVIYSPGSTAGQPISILASLKAPDIDWDNNQEVLLEQIEGTVTALLSLVGLDNIDPISDPEHILLSKIIADSWAEGKDVDMGELIMQTQNPPFEKLGFFSVDQFFPKKKRTALAMKLNSIIAAPSFAPWITGTPLDIQSLLYTEEGKPKHSIFYIAHLSETERMFIVTLLYSAIETWMRSQSGTTSLRALVYFDEIFGYLPPTANPPSKKPMLRMFKQARAFGVGMVVATQNPVDIDYKGLSNAGTWFVGRLQTERDKERLLDGLQGASDGNFDRASSDKMLSGLGKRVFLINNVHERGGPQLFQTRWAMNYMAGPMTRNRLADLNALAGHVSSRKSAKSKKPKKVVKKKSVDAAVTVAAEAVEELPTASSAKPVAALKKYTQSRPSIADGLDEYYLPRKHSLHRALQNSGLGVSKDDAEKLALVYLPGLYLQTNILFTDRKSTYSEERRYAAFIPDPEKRGRIQFKKFAHAPMDLDELDSEPEDDVLYGAVDDILQSSRKVSPIKKQYIDYLYREAVMPLLENKALKLTSDPDESERAFLARCHDAADEEEDEDIEKVVARFEKKRDRLEIKQRKEMREKEEDEATLSALKVETLFTYGKAFANIAGGFLGGRKRRSGVSSALTKRRQKQNAAAAVHESVEELAELRAQLDKLTQEHDLELQEIDKEWTEVAESVETIHVSPLKKNIAIEVFGVAWQPHWVVKVGGRTKVLPAG